MGRWTVSPGHQLDVRILRITLSSLISSRDTTGRGSWKPVSGDITPLFTLAIEGTRGMGIVNDMIITAGWATLRKSMDMRGSTTVSSTSETETQ